MRESHHWLFNNHQKLQKKHLFTSIFKILHETKQIMVVEVEKISAHSKNRPKLNNNILFTHGNNLSTENKITESCLI